MTVSRIGREELFMKLPAFETEIEIRIIIKTAVDYNFRRCFDSCDFTVSSLTTPSQQGQGCWDRSS